MWVWVCVCTHAIKMQITHLFADHPGDWKSDEGVSCVCGSFPCRFVHNKPDRTVRYDELRVASPAHVRPRHGDPIGKNRVHGQSHTKQKHPPNKNQPTTPISMSIWLVFVSSAVRSRALAPQFSGVDGIAAAVATATRPGPPARPGAPIIITSSISSIWLGVVVNKSHTSCSIHCGTIR